MFLPATLRALLIISRELGSAPHARATRRSTIETSAQRWLDTHHLSDVLPAVESWLADLSDDELETVAIGEQVEARSLMQTAPKFTDTLLNDYGVACGA